MIGRGQPRPSRRLRSRRRPAAADGRRLRWTQHRAERRAAFVAAGVEAIDRLGPDASAEQIAEAAGVSRTVLYRYFRDREDLRQAIADTSCSPSSTASCPSCSSTAETTPRADHHRRRRRHRRLAGRAPEPLPLPAQPPRPARRSTRSRARSPTTSPRCSSLMMLLRHRQRGGRARRLRHRRLRRGGRRLVARAPHDDARDRFTDLVSTGVWHLLEGTARDFGILLGYDEPLPFGAPHRTGDTLVTRAPTRTATTARPSWSTATTVVAVAVRLAGHFDPISGKYSWYGRVAAAPAGRRAGRGRRADGPAAHAARRGRRPTLSDVDPWGRPRVEGFGAAPFEVLDFDGDRRPIASANLLAMPVDQSFIGRVYPPTRPLRGRPGEDPRVRRRHRRPESGLPRSVAAAQALGYADVVAPPTFAIVLTLPAGGQVIPTPTSASTTRGSCTASSASSTTGPIVAGDILQVVVTVDDIRVAAGNDLVTTRAEVTTDGEQRRAPPTRPSSRGGRRHDTVGDQLPAQDFPIGRADLVRYAGASGDFNPIHWNERFAKAVGLPDVIAHGMFTMAAAIRVVTDWAGDPGAVVEYGVRFTRPVVVPDPERRRALVDGRGAGRARRRPGRGRPHGDRRRADRAGEIARRRASAPRRLTCAGRPRCSLPGCRLVRL